MDEKERRYYLGFGITTLIIILIYTGFLLYSFFTKSFFFKPYIQKPGNSELYQPNSELYDTPLTDEQQIKKQKMIADSKLRAKKNKNT